MSTTPDADQPVVVVVDDNNNNKPDNGKVVPDKTDSTSVIKDSTKGLDNFEIRTVPNQISNYAAAYTSFAADILGYGGGKIERLHPGEIYEPKKPDTFLQIIKWW